MTPSPQPAQSESLPAAQPEGQHRSLPAFEHVLSECAQTTSQVEALPVCVSFVQSFWSSHTGHDPGGSHVSPASTRPLPHPAQSPSFMAVQPPGQHPSPVAQVLTLPASTHWRWQSVPWSARSVHPMVGHEVGQLVPSQSSPGSSTPLPHTAEQLLSLTALQPVGQQASSFAQRVSVPEI
jgi:hypothetical protein